MSSQLLDVSRSDFIVAAALPASGNIALGTDSPGDVQNPRPFSVQSLLGFNHVSITLEVTGTPTGTVRVQVTDFGGDVSGVFGIADTRWVTTASTVALAGVGGSFWVNIPNIGAKFLRLQYAATSGTGTLNAAITCRACSRS